MSLVKEAMAPQAQSKPATTEHADIAMQFFNIMYSKKHAADRLTKSPGMAQKLATQRMVESDSGSDLVAGQAEAATGQTEAVTPHSSAPDRAQVIAQKLIQMGDELEKNIELMKQLREAFEKEFRLRSVMQMAYENFSGVCTGFLSRTKSRVSSGWQQVYLLYYGHYLVGEELMQRGGTEERIEATAHYLDDVMHDVGLDEWVDTQGGMASVGATSSGGQTVVEVPSPAPQLDNSTKDTGTSVDK